MAVTFRSSSTGNNLGSSVTVNKPAGAASGDLLLAMVIGGDDPATYSAPTGWSALGTLMSNTAGAAALYQKSAGSSEPSSYTFTTNVGNQNLAAAILDYTGAQIDVQAQRQSANGSGATSFAAASVTTTQASEKVVVFWAGTYFNGVTFTAPGGVTARANVTSTAVGIVAGDYTGPGSPGSSAPGSATSSQLVEWSSLTVALIPPAPPAPSLTAPSNAVYSDLQTNGGPFTWVYKGSATGGETGYHFRQKISGGSYNYWNAGGSAFQGTDIANTSTAQSITFAGGVWTDGNVYNWSVASVDSSGTGPYASDFTVTAQVGPSVTVTGPTGTLTTTQTPSVTWSDSLASGATQSAYRVVTYSAAQYGAPGFTPGSGPSLDDSGVVSDPLASSYTVVNTLPNNTTVASYVQITQSPGGQTSAWVSTGYTVQLDSPNTPTIVSSLGTYPGTSLPCVVLTVNAFDNYLTTNQAALVNGNTTGWTAGGGTTLSAATSPTPPTAEGTYSLQMAGSGTLSATTPTGTSGIAVTVGQTYSGLASFRSASTARNATVGIAWYNSSGTLLSTSTSSAVSDVSSAWTQASITAAAPANAAFAAIVLTVSSAGENHFVVEMGLFPGTVSTWARGGLVGSTTLSILRSDGVYVRLASTTNPTSIPVGTQSVVVYDPECVPTVAYSYTATISAVVGASTISSPTATSSAQTIAAGQGWWWFNPTNPTTATLANAVDWNPSVSEQAQAHQVLGQQTAAIMAYAVQRPDMAATLELFTAAQYSGMVALCTSQQSVFVSDPFGGVNLSPYYRLAQTPGGMGSAPAHNTQLQPSTSSGPHRVMRVSGIATPRPAV